MEEGQTSVKVIMNMIADEKTIANELVDLLKDFRELAESRGIEILEND